MKKLLALAVAAVTLVSASFALDFEIGGRFFLGSDFDKQASFKEIGTSATAVKLDSSLDYGFGAYANFALFGGLGIQGEVDLVKGSTSLGSLNSNAIKYDVWTLDVPVMAWLNLDLWRFTIGFGGGANFSFDLQSGNLKSMYSQTSANAKDNAFRMGIAAGADAKFYVTEHLGIVASGRFIMDFKKKEVPVVVEGYSTGVTYPTVEFPRRSLYGGLGLEWKFF